MKTHWHDAYLQRVARLVACMVWHSTQTVSQTYSLSAVTERELLDCPSQSHNTVSTPCRHAQLHMQRVFVRRRCQRGRYRLIIYYQLPSVILYHRRLAPTEVSLYYCDSHCQLRQLLSDCLTQGHHHAAMAAMTRSATPVFRDVWEKIINYWLITASFESDYKESLHIYSHFITI